jgi:trimeric autotransporter adhesin
LPDNSNQEVEAAARESGYNFNGVKKMNGENGFYTLSYESFVVPLVKAVQEQQQQINELKKMVETLTKK